MKSTGMVRRFDNLGRIVVPSEIRKRFGFDEGTAAEIYTEEDRIIIKKYQPGCILCGCMDNLKINSTGKRLCADCFEGFKEG